MKSSWWRAKDELDKDQQNFITLPPKGRYALIGPPGSGKTNLLLLRAQYIAGTGERNILFLTYTKALSDFIKTGINPLKLITSDQVKTFHSWAYSHILEHLGEQVIPNNNDFDDDSRIQILEMLIEANNKLPGKKIYSAIFVDEAQDLTLGELEALLCLSDNVCICGDDNQGIYRRNGLEVIETMKLTQHRLNSHFRIGQKIARAADRLCPSDNPSESLEATSNYNIKTQGESSANMHVCDSKDMQFDKMVNSIKIQLDAFKDENIGIFCGKKETLVELRDRFNNSDLDDIVVAHGIDEDASFSSEKRIHIMTIHAAKGTEFRAVHIFNAEDLAKHPLNRSRIGYTAITRAKTSLNVYRTKQTNRKFENAFSEPKNFTIDDLF